MEWQFIPLIHNFILLEHGISWCSLTSQTVTKYSGCFYTHCGLQITAACHCSLLLKAFGGRMYCTNTPSCREWSWPAVFAGHRDWLWPRLVRLQKRSVELWKSWERWIIIQLVWFYPFFFFWQFCRQVFSFHISYPVKCCRYFFHTTTDDFLRQVFHLLFTKKILLLS